MTLIDRLWAKAEPILYVTREKFEKDLEGWDIQPVYIAGDLAFITKVKGPEFHFHSLDTRHAITRTMIRDFLRPIIAKHGYAETKTPHEDERQHRFNRIFGFEAVGRDEFDVHYRISTMKEQTTCR